MKVLVALSGGVDSSVAALLLRDQGLEVSCAYMKNWINEDDIAGHCPWEEDIRDARAAADALGLPFEVVNFIKDYRERIVSYLLKGYQSGITPNPDVMCNREMKFGVLLDYALSQGFEAVATGHYAIRRDDPDGTAQIWEGADKNKDQSYFLALLKQEQIRRALFPVGHLQKPELRELARRHGLPNAEKKDSQGICFIGQIKMGDFLAHYLPDHPGPITDHTGRNLGEHKGLHRFTLGQRKGLGIPSNTDHEHYVVVRKDYGTNTLVVAFESKAFEAGLLGTDFRLHNLSWTASPVVSPTLLLAKPRYRDASQEIAFEPQDGGSARIRFKQPQRALTPGQICALYDGEKLLGGGVYF